MAPGRWQQLPGTAIAGDLLDPQAGVTTLATAMTNVTLVGAETVDGTEAHHLTGRVPNDRVATFLGTAPIPGETAVDLWIGIEDSLVRRVELRGPTVEGDAAEVVRALEFSAFDEPVTIEPPVSGLAPAGPPTQATRHSRGTWRWRDSVSDWSLPR